MPRIGWRLAQAAAVLLATAGFGLAAVAADDGDFYFSPQPRWDKEPETEDLCKVIAKECPRMIKKGEVDSEIGFDELYDVRGMFVGIRLTKSTGCKALDEDTLLSHRAFRMDFHEDGKPDLDDVHAEVGEGVDPAKVRIVKADGTSISVGCE